MNRSWQFTDETETKVIISKEFLDSLLDDENWRCCLESGGVDNWEWYSESLREGGYFGEDDEE